VRTSLLAIAVVVALPRLAAAGDGESAASVGVGVGTFVMPGEMEDETIAPVLGGVVVGAYERGFSEALSWRIEASSGVYGGGGVSWTAAAAAGVVYRFDVLKYVPYALVEVGGVIVGGGPVPETTLDPVLAIGGGLDLLRSRSRSWGIEARVASFARDVTTASLAVRTTRRWGYF
jgi:hypothetical protein